MLTDQHVLRVVVGPVTPNFPPGMRDAYPRDKIIVAEAKLLGEISPDHGHRIVQTSHVGRYRQHGREADYVVMPESAANLRQVSFVEEGAVAGRLQIDSADFYVERVFLRRDQKVGAVTAQLAADLFA